MDAYIIIFSSKKCRPRTVKNENKDQYNIITIYKRATQNQFTV